MLTATDLERIQAVPYRHVDEERDEVYEGHDIYLDGEPIIHPSNVLARIDHYDGVTSSPVLWNMMTNTEITRPSTIATRLQALRKGA